MSDQSTEDDVVLVPREEFEEGLQRVRNLAEWVALGGCLPTQSIWD